MNESLRHAFIPMAVGMLDVVVNMYLGREFDPKLVLVASVMMALVFYTIVYVFNTYVVKNGFLSGDPQNLGFYLSPVFWCTLISVLILSAVLRDSA